MRVHEYNPVLREARFHEEDSSNSAVESLKENGIFLCVTNYVGRWPQLFMGHMQRQKQKENMDSKCGLSVRSKSEPLL